MPVLLVAHAFDGDLHLVHELLAAIEPLERLRTVLARTIQLDRLRECGEALVDEHLDRLQRTLLPRVVGDEALERAQVVRLLRDRVDIRAQEVRLSRQQEPPLAGLGVHQREVQRLERLLHLERVLDLLRGARELQARRDQRDRSQPREREAQHEKERERKREARGSGLLRHGQNT